MSELGFTSVLLDISNQLSDEQLDKLKFLVQDVIGKRARERVSSARELFELLTERGRLSADSPEYLAQLLAHIQRDDLSARLLDFHSPPRGSLPAGPEQAKLDAATEVIVENLGKTWRKLGRRLEVSEVKLESIARRHPTDLEETTRELLKEWRRSRGAQAQASELIQALRACQYNMTADKVEDRLSALGH